MKIVTKNGNVVGIETASNVYYLREPKSISEAKKHLDIIREFEGNFDISLIDTTVVEEEEEWTTAEEVKAFYDRKYPKTQAFFKILAEKGDKISAKELRKEMEKLGLGKLSAQSLSGIRAGNTKSYENLSKESLDESEWNRDEWQNYYRIKPKYLKLLRRALGIE